MDPGRNTVILEERIGIEMTNVYLKFNVYMNLSDHEQYPWFGHQHSQSKPTKPKIVMFITEEK
jgi:hypothetical protein